MFEPVVGPVSSSSIAKANGISDPNRIRVGQTLTMKTWRMRLIARDGRAVVLDVLPHPQFASNKLLYFSYAKPNADSSQGTTAVARAKSSGSNGRGTVATGALGRAYAGAP